MRRPPFLLALVLSQCDFASPLAAQETTAAAIGLGGVDNLLGRVESINIYYRGSLVDSEFVGNRERPPPDERAFDFDLGIGYGQMDGLSSGPPCELHGSVRELPSVSAYATARLSDRFGVYAGVRTGSITLQDAQLYVLTDEGTALFTLSSTSFEFGAPLGCLTYDPSSGFPPTFPRSLNLSGLSWSVGVQFPLP